MTTADEAEVGGSSVVRSALRELSEIDRAVYDAIARQPTPVLDRPVSRLSQSANYSGIWIGVAATLSIFGGESGRRAARRGLTAVVITSATINVAAKSLSRRRRPARDDESLSEHRLVRMPDSSSFPSGHSASAFAFAVASSSARPGLAVPLRLLAASVAYSRVHTGVHYPGDVIVGSLIGSGIGQIVGNLQPRRR
jgi:undecaprenyl-diphosphatase